MKTVYRVTSISFVALLALLTLLFVLVPDQTFSEQENRTLTASVDFSFKNLADGTFFSQVMEYFADQFPFRDLWVGFKGVSETVLAKGENNGVLNGRNGQLAVRAFDIYRSRLDRVNDMDYYYAPNVEASVKALNDFAAANPLPLVTLLPPRSVDVAASAFSYPQEISQALQEQLVASVSADANFIDLYDFFRSRYDAGEYVYYRTDHHWTTRGAYLAYCEIMKKWGLEGEIIPADAFTVTQVPDFYGTTWSRAGLKLVGPDTLEVWSLGDEADYTTECISSTSAKDESGKAVTVKKAYKTFSGWMNDDYLTAKDKYAAFLDGTHNELTVTKTQNISAKREKLLVVKDSFANTLVPFLARHFDLVIVNLAGRLADASAYAQEYGCDRILIVYNRQNLIENANLAMIK